MKAVLTIGLLAVVLGGGWYLSGHCCGAKQAGSVAAEKPLPALRELVRANDSQQSTDNSLAVGSQPAAHAKTAAGSTGAASGTKATATETAMKDEPKIDEKWAKEAKAKLTPEQYDICFLAGTEPPGSGKYDKFYEHGMYYCAVCGAPLFSSNTKYDSHSGWPAFWDMADAKNIQLVADDSLGMQRTEVRCVVCGAHLGHVFDDGPPPTGKRYCINSLALEFRPAK
jgi:peptide-methionine (R)-S-oxide reductase